MDWLKMNDRDQFVVDGLAIFPNSENERQFGNAEFTTSPTTAMPNQKAVTTDDARNKLKRFYPQIKNSIS
jgi:hypothetical protein